MEQGRSSARVSSGARDELNKYVSQLTYEIMLAIRWDRPAILFAVYPTKEVMKRAQAALTHELKVVDQKTLLYDAGRAHNGDIPLRLSRKRNKSKTVYFIKGLKSGGEEALRALNIRREYLVENRVRVVFWLTEEEERLVIMLAPDFWAFRHQVVALPPE